MMYWTTLYTICCSSGAELEFESFNPSGLAQHLHADGLSKGDCWSSHGPVPTGNICADCRSKTAQLITLKSQYGMWLYLPQKALLHLYSAHVVSAVWRLETFTQDTDFSFLKAAPSIWMHPTKSICGAALKMCFKGLVHIKMKLSFTYVIQNLYDWLLWSMKDVLRNDYTMDVTNLGYLSFSAEDGILNKVITGLEWHEEILTLFIFGWTVPLTTDIFQIAF